ncbi:uncharacterized protein LOC122932255 [Bufo gargarizans]|uniref:uncharacterized protein LOC122924141 n=1 Tax=Bufo gargarizans TaxID=30331 RepID=UPI001CF2FCCC|nr:uncharacterized protein LOC122924141 [Bufo gargarizans]XP_044142537.1 uncharacterized protein LOC122932255 [Bufo gargarizans]
MSQVSDVDDTLSLPGTSVSSQGGPVALRRWTVPRLVAELAKRGIRHPASARKAELYRLLMTEPSAPEREDPPPAIQQSLVLLQASLDSLISSVADIRTRVVDLESRTPASSQAVVPVSDPPLFQLPAPGTSPAAPVVAPAHLVPDHIRRDILAGKDVNLASILIASHDAADNKTFDCGEVSVVLRAKDGRLNRKLSVVEFVLAFGLFRDVLCSAFPARREELDTYLHRVTGLGHKYGGTAFYDYHRSFSAKAAAALAQFQFSVNWAMLDMELFCQHFAGLRAPACSTCQSIFHSTEWCPQTATAQPDKAIPGPSGVPRSPSTTDKLGRPIVYLGNSQVCNNFNFGSCLFSGCRALHICSICFRAHPRSTCPKKAYKRL